MKFQQLENRWSYAPQTDDHLAEVIDGNGEIILTVEEKQRNEDANKIAEIIVEFPQLVKTLLDVRQLLKHNISNGQIDHIRTKINETLKQIKLK